jgi:hypothetical protein
MGRSKTLETWGRSAGLVLLGGLLLAWSWGRWLDPMVDFGRELYVPWRLAEGDVLFADIAHNHGALSAYLNAAAFSLFGVGVTTLVWMNVAVLAVTAFLVDRFLRPLFGTLAATVGVAVLLGIFAFCQLVKTGNFNFITPYSHEMTHGVALSLGTLVLLERGLRSRSPWTAAAVGSLFALLSLTKVEFLVAAAAGVAVRVGLDLRVTGFATRRIGGFAGAAAAGFAAPLAVTWLLFLSAGGAGVAAEGVTGAWSRAAGTGIAGLSFYRKGFGLDDPSGNLLRMATWAAGWVLVFGGAAWAAILLGKKRQSGLALGWAIAAPVVAAAAFVGRFPWSDIGRPLPLALAVLGGGYLLRAWSRRGTLEERSRAAAAAAFAVFALMLLLKMILNTRFYHYGFVLAMPGTVFVAAWIAGEAPRWIARRDGHAGFYRTVVVAVIVATALLHLRVTDKWYSGKTVVVGSGADAFRAGPEGEAVRRIAEALRRHAGAGDTLAVVPEGAMVNYLERRKNPAKFVTLLPVEFTLFGEAPIVDAFRRHPPDWVVISAREVKEFGFDQIGVDYGRDLMDWIERHYVQVDEIEVPAIRDQSHGRAILGRFQPGP